MKNLKTFALATVSALAITPAIAADLTIRLSAPDDGEGGDEGPTEGGQ